MNTTTIKFKVGNVTLTADSAVSIRVNGHNCCTKMVVNPTNLDVLSVRQIKDIAYELYHAFYYPGIPDRNISSHQAIELQQIIAARIFVAIATKTVVM